MVVRRVIMKVTGVRCVVQQWDIGAAVVVSVGGSAWRRVSMGIGPLLGTSRRSPKHQAILTQACSLQFLGSTRMYRELILPTSGPEMKYPTICYAIGCFISLRGGYITYWIKFDNQSDAPGPNSSDHNVNTDIALSLLAPQTVRDCKDLQWQK
ncbi:hypothetical protein Tco_1106981 [Tanacetum coccineum]